MIKPTLETCVEWAIKAGLNVSFFTKKTAWQLLYCCTFEGKVGSKTKSYQIQETSIAECTQHIIKNYKEIYIELSCPPLVQETLRTVYE